MVVRIALIVTQPACAASTEAGAEVEAGSKHGSGG